MHKSLVKQLALPLRRQSSPAKWPVMLKLFGIATALMLSSTASAVGLGGINVASALGQTLKADIVLVDISKNEISSLVVGLASPEAYKNSGLEYPYGNKFKFKILSRPDGQPYIDVNSAQPVNDPFVSLLVQLTWPSGQLSREYTFLLDPPGYQPVQPAPVHVQAVPPVVQESTPIPAPPEPNIVATSPTVLSASATEATTVQKSAQETPAQQAGQTAPQATLIPAKMAAAMEVTKLPKNQEWLKVRRGDTMYKIAEKYKLADMNLDRMLVALYRVNADKFDGKNMNRIKSGKILRLPTEAEYSRVTQAEAMKEIHAQAADWNAYRQKLASAAQLRNESHSAQQVATGKISSSVADMAPIAKDSAKEVLKLSRGEAPGDGVVSGAGEQSTSDQASKNAAQEDAIAQAKTLKEDQARTALLEKNIQDMQRLEKLKVEAAALAQAPAAEKTAVSAVAPTPTVIAKAKPVTVTKAKVQVPEPSLLDQILAEPIYLAGGAAALLALAGLGFLVYRRKQSPGEFADELPEDVSDIAGRIASPVLPSPDTGDFTVKVADTQIAEAPEPDIVDPISEADLFLNFGRDVQAEEILKDALQNSPNNPLILLKLLGIYANRKDATSFSEYARKLQDSGDEAAWQQGVAMGRKLEPDNPMYGGGFRSMEDTGSATVQVPVFNPDVENQNVPKAQASVLDFDFDLGEPDGPSDSSSEQNFLNDMDSTSTMTEDDRRASTSSTMDFDITSDKTLSPTAAESDGGLDFDITATNPAMPAASEPEKKAAGIDDDPLLEMAGGPLSNPEKAKPVIKQPEDDGGMAFTLDFPVEDTSDKPANSLNPAAGNFADINLNFDDIPTPAESATESKDDNWQDVATKLDLAKAYHEMGDASGAREILEEVMREGDAEQRESAQALFEQLG